MKFMNIQMEYSKMGSEPSEYMWKTRVILIHFGELFWKNAQEVWERNWMNLDLHTMLLDTKPSERHVVEYVQSNIDGDDSEETS